MAPFKLEKVIIVGAGPAGLLLALLLGKSGIDTQLLERLSEQTDETRAVFYNPVAQYEFQRAGILDDVMREALRPSSVGWRDGRSGKRLFGINGGPMICLPLETLTAIIQGHVQQEQNVSIEWSHNVIGLGQDAEKAWVDVETPGGEKRMEAQFIIGCDGATSVVRRHLLGEKAMPGFTWDKQLVAADIRYDFPALADIEDSNLFMDANDAWLAFRTTQEQNRWRLIFREKSNLGEEEILARAPTTIEGLIPGAPKPGEYEVIRIRSYKIHQRLVEKMREGRFLLASDAAHLCCPYGALGLNGGIADIGSLYDCLMAIHEGKTDESILDVYSSVRRDKWKTIIDPQSQATLKMVFSDPDDFTNHPVYRQTQMLAKSPELAKKGAPDPYALRYDFSQHFKSLQ